MKKIIRIVTRKSPLALWQANYVAQQLKIHHPQLQIILVTKTTTGDKLLDTSLAKIGGKGLFVKELEQAMLEGEADIAVHSMKDVPILLPDGLKLSVICPRGNPFDAFVSNKFSILEQLPQKAVVGTSSLRRQSQLKLFRPDLIIKDLRGNVGTRLAKLDNQEYDAIILACAGLIRLEMKERIKQTLDEKIMLPAIAQGAVGIEIREDDIHIEKLLEPLHCSETAMRISAERAFNKTLNGGCQVPIAGYSQIKDDKLFMRGLVAEVDGSHSISAEIHGDKQCAESLGEQLANELIEKGANVILQKLMDE